MMRLRLSKAFDAVIQSTSDRFSDLASVAGLDPRSDFTNLDFRDFDFTDSDLTEFRFSGCELYGADLSQAKLSPKTLAGAMVGNAILPIGFTSGDNLRLHVGLSPDEDGALNAMFGSIQRAAVAAIQAAGLSPAENFRSFIWRRVDTQSGFFRDNQSFKSIGVSLTESQAENLSRLSNIAGQPMWITLNFLLSQAVLLLHEVTPVSMSRFDELPAFVEYLETELMLSTPSRRL